jgi:tetratricopeptide (TPR) repeat protein
MEKRMKGPRNIFSIALVVLSAALFACSCSSDPQKAKLKYLAAGQSYMEKGQYGDAAIEFRNALRLDPRFVNAYYQLAQASLARHDWATAYGALEKAVELNPTRLDARLDRGRLYLAARQFHDADEEATFILKQDPTNVGAYQLLGAALIGEQKPDKALVAFEKVTELLPNSSSAYVNIALVEVTLHRLQDAERHLRKAVSVDSRDMQAYMDLANFYRLQNRITDAQQALQDGISKNPAGTALYIDRASMLISQGQKEDAEALLDELRKQPVDSADAAVAIGDFYFQQKETNRALAEYQRGLSIGPKSLEVRKRILDLYLSTGQTQLAAELDRELGKESPKDVTVRIDHGRLLMAQGKISDAINTLQKVVVDASDSAQANYFLAMAYLQNDNMAQAHSALLEALKASPDLPIALQALSRLNLAQGNFSDAANFAQELVEKFPADNAYRQLLAEALARQGRTRQAEEQFLVAERLTPNDSNVRLGLAQLYSAEKKWSEAQTELETILHLDPHNMKALAQLVDVFTAKNQSSLAASRVQQYVTANPGDASGHVLLGALHSQSKNYDAAQKEFERSIELDPNNVQAYLRLGQIYEVQGQADFAIQRYQKALDLQPKLAALSTMIGNLYLNKKDLGTARKYYAQALEADPNFAIANANIAWVDAQQGKNLDVALGRAQKAKSLMPDLPSITDTLAWVMYKRGNYEQAVPLLQDCIQKAPDSSQFHYHLGLTLIAAGQKAKGREQLESALRLKLDNADAQEAHQVLAAAN